MNKKLEKLLQNNTMLWRGAHATKANQKSLPTGFVKLDAVLPAGGWPLNSLVEIIVPEWGAGELQLLLPALLASTQQARCVIWVAPPFVPYAPELLNQGALLEQILVLSREKIKGSELWVMEKMLRAQACGIAMCWPKHLSDKATRRLQIAAETGHSLGFMFRNKEVRSSPAALRLRLTPIEKGLQIDVLKARGGSRFQTVFLGSRDGVVKFAGMQP